MNGHGNSSHEGSEPISVSTAAIEAKSEALNGHRALDRDATWQNLSKLDSRQQRKPGQLLEADQPPDYCNVAGLRKRMASATMEVIAAEKQRMTRRNTSLAVDVRHAAKETWILTRLTIVLLGYLGLGYKWMVKAMWLMAYAAVLSPGLLQALWYYFFSGRVWRSIAYGTEPRNSLDLYMPEGTSVRPRPVVIFVTGGAWIIGYKGWGALLGQALSDRGIIVASIDYRNFPQGTVSDMVRDINTGVAWVFNEIECYGGDPQRVYLVGQSAGAHLSTMAMLLQATCEANAADPQDLSWRASGLRAYLGISGGYNLLDLVDHFHARGLSRSVFLSVMEGEKSLPLFSPELMVASPLFDRAACRLPPITLYHGTADISIPHSATENFVRALEVAGIHPRTMYIPGKTHTDLILQDPMRGGRDELMEDLLGIVHEGDPAARAADQAAPPRRRMLPEVLLWAAHWLSPF